MTRSKEIKHRWWKKTALCLEHNDRNINVMWHTNISCFFIALSHRYCDGIDLCGFFSMCLQQDALVQSLSASHRDISTVWRRLSFGSCKIFNVTLFLSQNITASPRRGAKIANKKILASREKNRIAPQEFCQWMRGQFFLHDYIKYEPPWPSW